MIDVFAVTAIIVSLAAGLCGHASQPFPPARWWRTLRAWHRRTQTWRNTPAVDRRRPRRTPSWSRR